MKQRAHKFSFTTLGGEGGDVGKFTQDDVLARRHLGFIMHRLC